MNITSHMETKFYQILTLILLTFSPIFSQNQQGNIVQYFGKEKVESIKEGKLIYTFQEGLIIGQNRFSVNSVTTPKDFVVGNHLMNPNYAITEGAIGIKDEQGNNTNWEAIKVNDKSEFNDRRLRSGYLYLEYSSDKIQTVLFEASGHTKLIANGLPHEGDHYDFGYSIIPIELK